MKETKNAVYYSDFGVVGDGATNDFEAIYNAHNYANENNLPVFGDPDKTYYIGTTEKDNLARSIIIKTNTDWRGAKFIIDDTNIAHVPSKAPRDWNTPVIVVRPYTETLRLEGEAIANIGKIGRDTKKIDLGLGYPALLVVYNVNHRIYIRYGANANSGNEQREVVLVDKDGNIDPSTPFLLDYDEVSYIEVIRDDIEPLVVENATFTCYASRVNTRTVLEDGTVKKMRSYFHRGLEVQRSHTKVRNVKNYLAGEFTVEEQAQGFDGPAYHGFFKATCANDVLIEDCVVTARRYFTPGTYGFGANHVNNIVLKNCTQSNFYKPGTTNTLSMETSPLTKKLEYWGLGGTSFCKNMVYDSCFITRFDAHAGLYNGKIINSRVSMVNLIGGGDMLIENTVFEPIYSTLVGLRADYGSTWRGTITLKNCKVEPNTVVTPKTQLFIVGQYWSKHYFGYTCYSPNIVVDNLEIVGKELPIHITNWINRGNSGELNVWTAPYLCESTTPDGEENPNPVVGPDFIKVLNNNKGHSYDIVDAPIFKNTEIVGIKKMTPGQNDDQNI